MYETFAYGKTSKEASFKPICIKRNEPGENDIKFDVYFCGICHTDVHFGNDDMGRTKWPLVPGHELAGVVTEIGCDVKSIQVGDHVGVGCIVDSCMSCQSCKDSEEQYCNNGMTMTYNGDIKHGHIATNTGYTFGGYSGSMTVNERYVVRIPKSYPLAAAGPIFCAGITLFDPLVHWGALNGSMKIGIVGIGGLGQMGVRLAAAMGNHVTAISSSAGKRESAIALGAKEFLLSNDAENMASKAGQLDLILNTISANHQVSHYIPLLARDGTIVQLGLVGDPHEINQSPLMFKRLSISGSLIGGMNKTQECMDFCAANNIVVSYEVINSNQLDEIYKKLEQKNDMVIRYVLDCQKSEH